MVSKSIEFDARIKGFKFSKDYCFKGGFKGSSDWKKVRFNYYIDDKKISQNSINERERKIIFKFTLEMLPDFGEISFNGECILESPEQHKISFLLQNAPQPIWKFIDNFIIKFSFHHAQGIAKKNEIIFPPVQIILKQLGIK